MKLNKINIFRAVKMMSVVVSAIAVMLMYVGCSNDADVDVVVSEAHMQSAEVKGNSKNCAVVLNAQQGISYTMSVTSEGDWASLSGGKKSAEGVMETGQVLEMRIHSVF